MNLVTEKLEDAEAGNPLGVLEGAFAD
jgi:hypothetical protein